MLIKELLDSSSLLVVNSFISPNILARFGPLNPLQHLLLYRYLIIDSTVVVTRTATLAAGAPLLIMAIIHSFPLRPTPTIPVKFTQLLLLADPTTAASI